MRTPARWRPSIPPTCIRQDASPATSTWAPVSRTWRALSAPIAIEVSEFLTAKVPPKPQHSVALGQLAQVDVAHRPQQLQRPVADPEHPQRVAGRVVGHRVREGRPDVGHAEHVDEELAQLVGARPGLRDRVGEPLVAGPAGHHRVLVAGGARRTTRWG